MAKLSHAECRCLGFISKAASFFSRGETLCFVPTHTGAYFGSQPDLMVPEGVTNKCWLGGCSPMGFKASGNVLLWEMQIFQSRNISECFDSLLRQLLVHRATLDRIRQDGTSRESEHVNALSGRRSIRDFYKILQQWITNWYCANPYDLMISLQEKIECAVIG